MGQFLHGSAKTKHAVRAELQRSTASTAELARRYGFNEKTVRKWRSRSSVEDVPTGPNVRKSTVLSAVEEAAIVSLQVRARLPVDDIYIALKDVIPHLSRSRLHRCLQRHGISRRPKVDREKPERFKTYDTRSVTFTSTLPNCDTREAKPFSSSLLIGRRRLSSPESIAKRRNLRSQAFSKP